MGKLAEQIKKQTERTAAIVTALKDAGNGGTSPAAQKAINALRATPGVEVSGKITGLENDLYGAKGLGFARAARIKAYAAKKAMTEADAFKVFEKACPTGMSNEAVKKTLGLIDEERFGAGMKGTIEHAETFEKALGESTWGGGGVFVPDELSAEFIDVLRAEIALLAAPVERIPMARETMTFARESVASSPGWVGENSPATFTEPQFDAPQLQLKKLGAQAVLSNDLLRDASIAADVIVRNDLIKQSKLVLDLALIRGIGSQFSPKGIRYIMPAGNVFGSNAGSGTPTLQNALSDITKLKTLLDTANVPDMRRFLIANPRTYLGMEMLRDGVGGTPLGLEMGVSKTLRGLPFYKTTQIPTNLSGGGSGGSAESELYIAEGTEIIVGEGLQPTVEVTRGGAYEDAGGTTRSGLVRDQTVVVVFLRYDIIQKHAVSTACGNGMTYGS